MFMSLNDVPQSQDEQLEVEPMVGTSSLGIFHHASHASDPLSNSSRFLQVVKSPFSFRKSNNNLASQMFRGPLPGYYWGK